MTYLSVCSGIEAASCAWHDLGWNPVGFSEIEPFPCKVLAHHFPEVPNFGDMKKYENWPIEPGTVDVLIGGTPCQSFSVAGLRKGLDDPRGNLALVYLALVDRIRPRYVVWENVPGVLSSNKGRDFGSFLGGLVELGYGFAYRVLDAQYWGVAQRRRRLFVVGCLGNWQRAAAILFERESCTRNTPARRKAGEETAVAFGVRTANTGANGCGIAEEVAYTLDLASGQCVACCEPGNTICFEPGAASRLGRCCWEELAPTLRKESFDNHPAITTASGVRRLTPTECERLQGFPDGHTKIAESTPDEPRYKALGNSMAVPVIKWIGQRIQAVDEIIPLSKSVSKKR